MLHFFVHIPNKSFFNFARSIMQTTFLLNSSYKYPGDTTQYEVSQIVTNYIFTFHSIKIKNPEIGELQLWLSFEWARMNQC